MKVLVSLLLILIVVPEVIAQQASASGKTVWSGIYSVEQATRGEQAYKARCARCHGASLEGSEGNALTGRAFMEKWREGSMGSLFEFISVGMPPARPNQGRPLISIPDYLDIVAFILSKNEFPAGPNALVEEGLDAIQIQYKDGPRPVPNGALVRVSGCLTGSGQDWTLTHATEPARTKTPRTTDYQEFQSAETAPPGTESFGLVNFGMLGNSVKPESLSGAKLLVKGILIRQPNAMRITVMGVRKVADSCQ